MVAQSFCPEPDLIRDLLCGDLPECEQDEMASHLEVCHKCRQQFEAEASGPEFFGDAARLKTDCCWENETASLERLMRDIPPQLSSLADAASIESWSTEAVAEFLEPSDEPGHLGRLGSYEIVEVIGRGGMGIVLRGIDLKLNRVVAIKVLAPELASNPNARRRFFREGQAAAAVSHDHVVTIHAVDDSDRLPHLVMEFIQGESLEDCVRRTGSMSIEAVLRMGRQMALGLSAAHKVGLVHRDMKPANILLENGIQRVRITDFGLARAVDDVGMTQTGVVTGTPLYMSPEQASGEALDHRSDLFSLGSILYTMCTGRPAFRAEKTMAVLKRVCEDSPRPIRSINPEVPNWLAEIVDRLMKKNPVDRIQSAAEVAELLGSHLAHLQDPHNSPAPASMTDRSRSTRKSRPLLLAVSLIIVSVLGATEVSGVTGLAEYLGVILKLRTPDGTLIVEIEDPDVTVSVDGNEIVIDGVGVKELRLKPGKHQWMAERKGIPAETSWVTIERGGKTVVRVKQLLPETAVAKLPATDGADGSSAGRMGLLSPGGSLGVSGSGGELGVVIVPADRLGNSETIEVGGPGEERTRQPSFDGVVFLLPQNIRRFHSGQHTHGPGGEHTFEAVPSQLWGQSCTSAIRDGGQMQFVVHRRFHDVGQQRLWLLICESDWETGTGEDGVPFDTPESLSEAGWHKWRTINSHPLTDRERKNRLDWSIYYSDAVPGKQFTIRTNSRRTPLLVWGSIDMDGIVIETTWDQRIATFNNGASVPLGNGHHIFSEVPEFLKGRLYTQRNGYVGIARFGVTRPQRVTIGLYHWRYMYDGNSSGGWQEELTTADQLEQDGWIFDAVVNAKHSNGKLEGDDWYFYSRNCKAGETFAIRNHKYLAPIILSQRANIQNAPPPETPITVTAPDIPAEDSESPITQPTDPQRGAAIRLNFKRSSTQLAPASVEDAVYGVGGPTALTSDLPTFFAARATGRHPDGSVKLVGQLRGVRPGDTVKIDRFERTSNQIRLVLNQTRKSASQNAEAASRADNRSKKAELDTAVFEKLLKESSDRDGNGRLLLAFAQHLNLQAWQSADPNEAAALRQQARHHLVSARKLFEIELAALEARSKTYTGTIDLEVGTTQLVHGQKADLEHSVAQLNLAWCLHSEAETQEPGSESRSRLFMQAAGAFEKISQRYRSQTASLYARLWQGRALQQVPDHRAAATLFHDLLQHPGRNDEIRRIRNEALHLTLISRNELQCDAPFVVSQGADWFDSASAEDRKTDTAAGILWEMSRAVLAAAGSAGSDSPPVALRTWRYPLAVSERNRVHRSILKLLKDVETTGPQKDLIAKYEEAVRAMLDGGVASENAEEPGQTVLFQIVLPALPPGSYKVQAVLQSVGENIAAVNGQFVVSGNSQPGRHLKELATKAIMMKAASESGEPGNQTQQSTGMDLSPLTASTLQHADLKAFLTDHSLFEPYCSRLGRDRKPWALCEVLDFPNVDAKIHAARELTKLADPDTVSVLLAAAKRNNFGIDGSENATLHSIYRATLQRALQAATGLALTPCGLKLQTTRQGKTVTLTSESDPDLFAEEVDFARVEAWLRNDYLADATPRAQVDLDPEMAETGLVGRTIVEGKDAGMIFHYPHATFFHQEQVPPQVLDSKGFEIPLEGYLVVPRDMTVKVWLAGGGVSHDVNWLYVDGSGIGSTGDNRGKSYTCDLPLLKGLHHVRWLLSGGTFRTNILVFADPGSGELMSLVNTGIAKVRHSPEEPVVRIQSNRTGWPIPDNWLPAVVEKQIDRTE